MGLFGSSRKKPRDSFHAAVEQHRRRAPTAMLRERESESLRQRNAGYFRSGGPFAWQESTDPHPYGQPAFGFYSGENLAAGRPRQQHPKRSRSVDEEFRNTPYAFPLDPAARDLPFSPKNGHLGPSSAAGWSPWLGLDPRAALGRDFLPYNRPEEQSRYLEYPEFDEYAPTSRMAPLSRSMSANGRRLAPQSTSLGTSTYPDRPIFDRFRPFNSSPVPNPYGASMFNRDIPSHNHPTWNGFADRRKDPFSGLGRANRPARPPGSYERLRPPHLQPGNNRAESGRGTYSSSSGIGET